MKTPRRVLLLSALSGAGHVRAAQALEKAFAARGDCAVEHVDALDYTSKLFQKIYDDIRCNNLPAAAWKIARLLDDPAQLARMRAAASAMARPHAAVEIAAEGQKLLKET